MHVCMRNVGRYVCVNICKYVCTIVCMYICICVYVGMDVWIVVVCRVLGRCWHVNYPPGKSGRLMFLVGMQPAPLVTPVAYILATHVL